MASVIRQDELTLREAAKEDIDELMSWFTGPDDILFWGGPTFRDPFTRETFFEDIGWGRIASFGLYDPAGDLVAFGQAFDRVGRIHLARLVVHPAMRGRGVGKRLVDMLMLASRQLFDREEYSLFVLRENTPAFECYTSMGFVVSDCPDGVPHADMCHYLTRPVQRQQQRGERNDQ